MFQNRHPANSAASSSGHHHPGGATTGGGHQQQQQQAMKSGGGGGGGPQQGGGPVVKDLLDRVQEEFGLLQQQLHNTRVELEKSQQERESVQRFAMAYQESVFPVHMEMQKHAEIAKRLTGILTHVIPLLPQDHQHSAVTAVERAKAISPQELQTLLNQQMQQQQMAAMLSAVSPAAAAAFNPAMMMAGMGLNMNIKPEEAMQAMLSLNNIFKNPSMLGAMPPAATMPGMPSSATAAAGLGRSAMQQQQPAAGGGRASSGLMNSGGGHNNSGGGGGGGRPRSGGGTPSTPNSSTSAAKRAKLEPEEGDGELEIDVQNDDASSSAAPSHHTNGRTSQPPKGGGGGGGGHERDTASASSSRDGSATPRSGKQQLSSTPCSSTGGVAGSSVPPPPHQPSSLGPLLPTPAGLANFFSTFPANLNSQMSGLFGLPPQPGAMPGSGGGQMPPGLGTALAVTNGKSPSYAFKMSNEQALAPVNFPDDVTADPHVPKGMKRIGDLPHGDVVCAVTMARDGRRVFTGGRGAIKMWDIGGLDRGLLLGGNNSSSAGGSDNGGGDGGSPSSAAGGAGDSSDAAAAGTATSNGGGGGGGTRRAGSAEPWAPVATFPVPCLKDSYIRSCKLFPDASTLIVGGETRHICLLDVEQAEVKMTLDCEVEACYALALSADCRLCFACCSNGTVVIWDLQSGERVAQLEGHSDGASCVDLSGDGQKLWTGGLDNTVRCWDIGERAEMEKQTLESQIFSLGCCPNDDWVAVGMEDQNVQVLNTSRPGDKYLLHGHQSCVLSLKFAHNGKWFVSTGKDYVVNCWRTPYGYRLMQSKETSSVLSCDISADDRYLLTGSGDRKASLYELSF